MATGPTRREEKPCPTKRKRIDLTPTGLLMEGVYTQNPAQGSDHPSNLAVTAAPTLLFGNATIGELSDLQLSNRVGFA